MAARVCQYCDGTGDVYDRRLGDYKRCRNCMGHGEVDHPDRTEHESMPTIEDHELAKRIFG